MAATSLPNQRQQGLQQAASVLFALMTILPLLMFAYTLYHLGAIHHTFAQVSLALTLALALLGFWMFRSMLAQMSDAMQGMSRMMEAVARQPRSQAARASASVPVTASVSAPATASVSAPATASTPAQTLSGVPRPPAVKQEVSGLGSVWELGEMARTMDLLWQREAHAHIGRRVQITVANAEELAGRLVEATNDGLLIEQGDGKTVAITYRRVQGIEPLVD